MPSLVLLSSQRCTSALQLPSRVERLQLSPEYLNIRHMTYTQTTKDNRLYVHTTLPMHATQFVASPEVECIDSTAELSGRRRKYLAEYEDDRHFYF